MTQYSEESNTTEATLDIEYITGIGNGVNTQFYHYDCTKESCHPFMSLITDIEKLDDNLIPNVLSLSVGVQEYE